mmetsp:Transcript_14098/g.42649  ORF Transcript_14098/g.42649 Transcript_14098/m.42649 type:complete len:503 (+) Transcript_14098:58-1566(+)
MPRQKSTKKKPRQEDGGQALYDQALEEKTPSVKATLLRRAMKAGHLEAHAEYGLMLCEGRLGRSDVKEALRIWRSAGDRGCGRSNYLAGVLAKQSGHYEVATKLFTKSIDNGYPEAHVDLGIMYSHGLGVEADLVKAAETFRRGQPHADPTFSLAICYQEGAGVEKDEVEAARLYKLAAAQGHGRAMTNLGNMYADGEGGLEKSEEEAVKLWKVAAEKGVPEAQGGLGRCYQYGSGGLKPDLDEALRLYRPAAEAGVASAQFDLASLLEDGRGNLQRDIVEAARLYQLAADQGHATACLLLGRMHDEGEHPGGGPDYTAARDLYHRAITAGEKDDNAYDMAYASVWLGSLIERGLGGHQDFDEAAKLYRRAIIFGSPGATADAAYHLGSLYERGLGVETLDLDEALHYYAMADEHGSPDAEDAIQSLVDRGLISSSDKDHQSYRKIRVCANCGLQTYEKLQKCARCRRAQYCSRECQKEAWPAHRAVCHRRSAKQDLLTVPK